MCAQAALRFLDKPGCALGISLSCGHSAGKAPKNTLGKVKLKLGIKKL